MHCFCSRHFCSYIHYTSLVSEDCLVKGYFFFLLYSGDGTLSAFDLRQKRLEQRSDPSESELLSLAIVKVKVSIVVIHVHTILALE